MSSSVDLFGSIGILRRLRCRLGWHGETSYGPRWIDEDGKVHWGEGKGGLNDCMTCNALFDGEPWKPGKMVAPSTMTFLGWNSREYYRREGEEPAEDATSMLWRIRATLGLEPIPRLSITAGTRTLEIDTESGEETWGPFVHQEDKP